MLIITGLALFIMSPYSAGTEQTTKIRVVETPLTLLENNRVYSWYVQLQQPTSHKTSALSDNKTLMQHNKLSVLAHAKSVTQEKVDALRMSSPDTIDDSSFGLVARAPSNPRQALQHQNTIAILPEVGVIRFEYSVQSTYTPNDLCFHFQPELHSVDTGYNSAIDVTSAWDKPGGQGSEDIIIGVLDSGIVAHDDLNDRVIINSEDQQDFVSSPAQAADGDGRDSDPTDPGMSNDCRSSGYHGTHVTGTLGAMSDNSRGIAGINWRSKIIPVRVLGPVDGSTGDIIDAVSWISKNPQVKVLNMSLGIESTSCERAFFHHPSFLKDAFNNNILTMVAAGNNHSDASDFSPANCEAAVTVAATNRFGRKAYYSNYGSEIDISAPGGELGKYGNNSFGILSTVNAGRYEYKQGTSMAAPVVSGVASLLYSANKDLTANEVRNILQATATPFQVGGSNRHGLVCDTEICGAGIVNAERAIQQSYDSGSNVQPPILFFLRQEQHTLSQSEVSARILLSKKYSTDIPFSVEVTSDSCDVDALQYDDLFIPAGSLEYSLLIPALDCTTSLSLRLNVNATFSSQYKNEMTVVYIERNSIPLDDLMFERIFWTYLEPSSTGNTHSIYLQESGTYHLSIISSMNTEIIIQTASGASVYDSRDEDSSDLNKHDYWIKYTLDGEGKFYFTVRERSNDGDGGIYATAITTAPDFSAEPASYCKVPLGVQSNPDGCTPNGTTPQQEDDDLGSKPSVITFEKTSSVDFYTLLTLFLLLVISSVPKLMRRFFLRERAHLLQPNLDLVLDRIDHR